MLLYLNLVFIVIRERSFVYSDSMEYTLNIPSRISMASFNNTNGTKVMSMYRQGAIKSPPRIVQSVNKTIKIPRKRNQRAHGRYEFVSKTYAISVNNFLMQRRDSQLRSYVEKTCANASLYPPCSFMSQVSNTLKRRKRSNGFTHFNSLRYTPTGTVCEGCRAIMHPKFLFKTAVNGLLIRKFIGNTETNEIYTVQNRIVL